MGLPLPFGPVLIHGDDSYTREVKRILHQIESTQIGRAILFKIRSHGFVVIRPVASGVDNAFANPPIKTLAFSFVVVEFSPWTFVTNVSLPAMHINVSKPHLYPGRRADKTLLHELTHAARFLGGDFADRALPPPMDRYGDEEEFFAVLLQNMYSSEEGGASVSLRGGHDYSTLAEHAKNPSVFLHLEDNYRLIEKFCRQHPRIAPMLARSRAPFNPIRVYFELTAARR